MRVEAGPKALRRRWRPQWSTMLIGRRVQTIDRRGKWIVVNLDRELRLVMRLGMTGQLTVMPARQPRLVHTHLIFDLDRGGQLRFRDVRRFGSATLFASDDEVRRFFDDGGLGPEPFDLEPDYWRGRLTSTERCLKAILLDQRVVAGVGNIYADEALFQARLHPGQLGRTITAPQAQRLRHAVVTVLRRAIDKRGSSIRDYIGGSGAKGDFQNEFRVYGRTDEPCLCCRRAIVRTVLAGRSTHYCPKCQRLDVATDNGQRTTD